MTSPTQTPTQTDQQQTPAEGHSSQERNGSQNLALSTIPSLNQTSPNGDVPAGSLPTAQKRSRSGRWVFLGSLMALVGSALIVGIFFFDDIFASQPEGLLLHEVKRGPLSLTVKQRGELESASNRDIICRVKTGSKRTGGEVFIRWLIDDGSRVKEGDKLIELDDSALLEERRTQQIEHDQALAEKINAEQQLTIVRSQNTSDIETARVAIRLAAIALEKYCGLERGSVEKMSLEEVENLSLVDREETPEKGEYRQLLDDLKGQIKVAESTVSMARDRASWSSRMAKLGFVSPTQAEADQATLQGSQEELNALLRKYEVLQGYDRRSMITDYQSQVAEAMRALERVKAQSKAAEAQAESALATAQRVYEQEKAELEEIKQQIDACQIYAPQDGMVVYYVSERSRFGNDQDMIAEGSPVHEGQKLMRLPDLNQMQVTMKVHESAVMNLKADLYESTGFSRALAEVQSGFAPSLLDRFGLGFAQDSRQDYLSEVFREYDQIRLAKGQPATIRVDALSGKVLKGHVKSVATVATQEWYAPEVKMFPVVVSIDEEVQGLRPNMSAQVTIHVEDTLDNVITLPIPAVVGGPEMGDVRSCYVMTPSGPEERTIKLGLSNENVVEVTEGLKEGEQVVLNPNVLLGEEAVSTVAPSSSSKGGDKDWKSKQIQKQGGKGPDSKGNNWSGGGKGGGGKGGGGKGGPKGQ